MLTSLLSSLFGS
jgi:hypothetical protein